MATLKFTVDSALLSELGERLVERVHIALAELIKNGYDADAQQVTLILAQGENGDACIKIADDGVGMTYQEVTDYWMRIATTNKVENDVSRKYGRPKTGAKGIGRFGCRRLGTLLQLETTALTDTGKYETTTVTFHWKDYTPGSEVTNIACEGARSTKSEGKAGTTLIIGGGDYNEWDLRSWNALKRQMAVLAINRGVKRRGFEEDPGFNIVLLAPDFEDTPVANYREKILDAGWGKLKIDVEKDGKLVCQLWAKKIGHRQITHQKKFPLLAGTRAVIAILPDKREYFRDTSVLSQTNLREILADWGGVFVRHRSMRVYPFGEPGNDWLNIDRDRASRHGSRDAFLQNFASKLRGVTPGRELLNLLSSRMHVGDVEIETPDPLLFVLKASREGFVGTKGIDIVREVVRFGIDWATIYRDYYLRLLEEDEAAEARKEFAGVVGTEVPPQELVKTAVAYVRKETGRLTNLLPTTKEKHAVSRSLQTATEAILRVDEGTGRELRHLRLIASTSSLVLIFSHEVRSLLGELDTYQSNLKLLRRKLPEGSREDIEGIREQITLTKKRFIDLLDMTSLLSVDSMTAKPGHIALASKVQRAINCFQLVLKNYGIEIDCESIPNSLKTGEMLEAELYAILLNVLSNAIKAVIAKGVNKEEAAISILAERTPQGTRVTILDKGVGVNVDASGELFVPFVADPEGTLYRRLKQRLNPEDQFIVGVGSGLGLSIVKEIVAARDGTVRFRQPEPPWKTCLEILLP